MNPIKASFKRQIFFIFLAVTLVLVITGGILTLQGFQARIRYDHAESDRELDDLIHSRLLEAFNAAEEVLELVAGNEELIHSLDANIRGDMKVYLDLYDASAPIREFASVDLYRGSECRYSTRSGGTASELHENYSLLQRAKDSPGEICYGADPAHTGSNGSDILIARCLKDSFNAVYAVVRIDEAGIRNRLGGLLNARDGFILANSMFRPFVMLGTAEDGHILKEIRSALFKKDEDIYPDEEGNVYVSGIGETGLLGIYVTMPVFERSALAAGYQIVMIQVVVSVLLCLFAASRMSALFAKPINTLSSAMKRFRKGDFDTKIELNREDEFGTLAAGFNKMTSQLKTTMEEMVAAERKVNEARIEMMQAQLNPHFLYNTLDTIKWVAKANQVPEIATLSTGLASILRTSISSDRFCPLSKELELVKAYCDIQKIRFDDSFDLEVDVPAELENAVVPKLILQPLVENSIIHGLEGYKDGQILVKAYREDTGDSQKKDLVILIKDNGKGISDEMIAALSSKDPEALSGHLGLNNINTIISLYYGNDYGVTAERPAEGGTVMTVRLPYSEDIEEVSDNDESNDR